MALSLRQRILWWSVASTLLILAGAFFVADEAFRTTIFQDQEENLRSGGRLVAALQQSEVAGFLDRTAGFASTPTLRAAVETRDSATIRQNLERMIEDSELRWLAVTTSDGERLAATEEAPTSRIDEADAIVREARFYDTGDLWRDDGLEQVHATGIFAGSTLLGVMLGGVPVGPERVERLESATRQRIAFLADREVVAGGEELSPEARADLAVAWSDASVAGTGEPGPVRELSLDGDRYLAVAIGLPDGTGARAGTLVAFRSLDEAMAPARTLRITLLMIGFGGILLAFASSYLLSRRVTRPVNRLLLETVRLGSGRLDRPIEPERDDEIGKLALGFEDMRVSLRDAREELVRAERLSAVGQAASAVVHDFRQPVTVIQGHVALLEADWEDEEQRREDLDVIRRELARLTSMMGEILDFARGEESVRVTEASVPELLDGIGAASRPLLAGEDVCFEVDHGYRGSWRLDFPRTHRALENLVRNSASVVEPGGTIRVASERTDSGLRLVVEDDGPGIPEEVQENLFEPFVTHGKKEGTGLGLAIVKAFVERQGGTVQLETSGDGTRFCLDFP